MTWAAWGDSWGNSWSDSWGYGFAVLTPRYRMQGLGVRLRLGLGQYRR